ncbi:MAG: ABC transporter substrate-binding protein [Eubacterium sp.]|nr:ABC transporter substrate-binding protein [Eubacterium sp.]
MMKKVISLILTGAMVLSLAACGSSGASQAEGSGDAAATTDEVAEGERVLKVGMDVEPTSIDPNAGADGQGGMFVAYSVFGTLWMLTADGETNMILAESYEYNEDKTEFTVHLREGIKFADGNPITADDVIYSLQNAAAGTGAMRLAAVDIENAYAEDETTVVLPLLMDSPTLIEDMNIMMIMEKEWCEQSEENLGLNVMASGAYSIESWETGMGITLVKNPEYYDAENVYYDEIDVSFVSSEDTRLLSFESGDYDIICLSSSNAVDEIAGGARADASVVTVPIQSVSGLTMNVIDFDEFKDQNVRQAIGYAIDVPTLVSTIMGSAYQEATSLLPSGNYAYLYTGNYEYDVDKAKELLKEAGYDENNRFAFTLTYSDAGMNGQLAEAIQAMLAEANIDVTVETQDGATYMNNMVANTIMCGFSTYMGSYEPAGIINARRKNIPANMSKLGDGELEDLLEECCTSVAEESERIELWHSLQEQSYEFASFIPIYESNQNYAVSDAINTENINSSVQADGYLFATKLSAN